jgi:hypothetical protein
MNTSKVKMEDVLSATKRVESDKQVRPITFTFILWLLASFAITVATGVYLWNYDTTQVCKAPNSLT